MRVLWVTRTEPGASRTAAALRGRDFEAVVEPLLEARPLADAKLDLRGVGAIAFTSANGVTAFAQLCAERELPVFAVGDATAAAARAAGFATVTSAGGEAQALAATIGARRGGIAGAVLYPAPAEPSADLTGALRGAGLEVRQVAVYETTPRAPSPAVLASLPAFDGAVLHSARAATALASVLSGHPAPRMVAFCLSAQVATPLAGASLAEVRISAAPNEAALLSLIGEAWP